MSEFKQRVETVFSNLGINTDEINYKGQNGLAVATPLTGEEIARVVTDSQDSFEKKIESSKTAQAKWKDVSIESRAEFLTVLGNNIMSNKDSLAELIRIEAGKSKKGYGSPMGEIGESKWIIDETIKAALNPEPEKSTITSVTKYEDIKERLISSKNQISSPAEPEPLGIVGVITPFNFPLAIGNWSLAPALLAGNSMLLKPSEHSPLTTMAMKTIFDKTVDEFNTAKGSPIASKDLLQLAIGGPEIGKMLVENENVAKIEATGGTTMGQAIENTLKNKKNNNLPPVLELSGNNAVVISNKVSPELLETAIDNTFKNALADISTPRCTNTGRLIVHEDVYDKVIAGLKTRMEKHMQAAGEALSQGKDPVTDQEFAFLGVNLKGQYEKLQGLVDQAKKEGAEFIGNAENLRAFSDKYPGSHITNPVIAVMPEQTAAMHNDPFGKLLFVTKYTGEIENAIKLVNEPKNADLVNAIYSQDKTEVEEFSKKAVGSHKAINRGTDTPTRGLGFGAGGHEGYESGYGDHLNLTDPLAGYCKPSTTILKHQVVDVAISNEKVPLNHGNEIS